ncbi:MAG TPA: OmpA family protein [Spirochaetota bacterium]|nr:OmpA family protein [Spirochaetota bacterium]
MKTIRLACAALFLLALPALLHADLVYWQSEYNALYNEKVALDLELKYLKKQYQNDRANLLGQKSDLQDRIRTLEGRIAQLEQQLRDEKIANDRNVRSLEDSLAILKKTSSGKEKALIEENRRIDRECKDEIERYRGRIAKENEEHLKKIEELSGDCNKKIAGLESLIADLNGEIANLKRTAASQKEELDRMGRQAKDLEDQLKEEIRQGDIRISRLHDRIIININNKILFESGSAELRKGVYGSLDKIKEILAGYPENRIMVEGHTDNVPIGTAKFRDNWQLSTERALAVLNYLLRNKNLKPARFSAVGYGEFNPLVPNDTDANRAQNRRVDITVKPLIGKQ